MDRQRPESLLKFIQKIHTVGPFESAIRLLGGWVLRYGFDANAASRFLDRGNSTGHWNDIADYSIPDFGC